MRNHGRQFSAHDWRARGRDNQLNQCNIAIVLDQARVWATREDPADFRMPRQRLVESRSWAMGTGDVIRSGTGAIVYLDRAKSGDATVQEVTPHAKMHRVDVVTWRCGAKSRLVRRCGYRGNLQKSFVDVDWRI